VPSSTYERAGDRVETGDVQPAKLIDEKPADHDPFREALR